MRLYLYKRAERAASKVPPDSSAIDDCCAQTHRHTHTHTHIQARLLSRALTRYYIAACDAN